MDEFQIIGCDADGNEVIGYASSHTLARVLARQLAVSSNRRAIVRRLRCDRFDVMVVGLKGRPNVIAMRGVSEAAALKWWKSWDHREEGAVCILWPSDVPSPRVRVG